MRSPSRLLVILVLAAAVAALSGAGTTSAGTRIACSTATAGGAPLPGANPSFTKLGAPPFGVATAPGYAFVATVNGSLDVLADHDSNPHVIHRIPLTSPGVGMTMTANGRYLLIADGEDGAIVVDVARAESGARDAVIGTLRSGKAGRFGGAIEVAASRDGGYAFVSNEGAAQIAVYRLAAAIADHFSKRAYVGAIPTGMAPVGLAVSPDGRWLYSTSEAGGPGYRGGGQTGSVSVIATGTAERDPSKSVVATTSAGCNPVRVAVSADGRTVWVTARASDDLLAFSSARLLAHASDPLLTSVRVGEAPVDLALVDRGSRIVVADSNRFGAAGRSSGLTVVSTTAALAHRQAIIGTVRSGLFPREMALEPAGTVLLVGNFESGTLESVHIAAHAQETRRFRAKTQSR